MAETDEKEKLSKAGMTTSSNYVQIYLIEIEIISASNLIKADIMGKSDPYCIVSAFGQSFQTKTIMKELNPTWNEKTQFCFFDDPKKLKFNVWDYDKNTKSDPIGDCELSLNGFYEANHVGFNGSIKLQNVKHGELKVAVKGRRLVPLELEERVKKLQNECEEQKQEIEKKIKEIEIKINENKILKEKNEKLQSNINELNEQKNSLETELKKLKETEKKLNEDLKKLKVEKENLENRFEEQTNELNKIKEEYEDNKKSLEEMDAKNKELNQQCETFQNQIKEYENREKEQQTNTVKVNEELKTLVNKEEENNGGDKCKCVVL